MLKYAIQTGKMNEIMELLFRVLNLRITFFDLQESEVDEFNIKEMSPFCLHSRRNAEFNARCEACDREHLRTAKRTGNIHIYHCHAGLLEGIVPLYDRNRNYLGSIVFGQLRDRDQMPESADRRLSRNRISSRQEMYDTGALLKYLSEYISENEIVRYCNKPWAERLEEHIRNHPGERLTLSGLAAEIGRSTSFLSHNFPLEFGVPLKEYLQQERMTAARKLLAAGNTVKETARELGFYDEFHFSRKFKQFWGSPPSRFKTR